MNKFTKNLTKAILLADKKHNFHIDDLADRIDYTIYNNYMFYHLLLCQNKLNMVCDEYEEMTSNNICIFPHWNIDDIIKYNNAMYDNSGKWC